MRAGRYVKQPTGIKAFIPASLPPDPPIEMDHELMRLLSDADRALGRLDAACTLVPNPSLFVAMYIREEAVFSSQIEGTQSSLHDVLQFELFGNLSERPVEDTKEVLNYITAMNEGLARLDELPLCLRLLREIHGTLLQSVRGDHLLPGEFRRSQNWIGSQGGSLVDATFIPPPVHEMHTALDNFEKFIRDRETYPVLIQCGIAHVQFESIHPFLDGNGRLGRLLLTLMLCEQEVLSRPLLYLSHYLKKHRGKYYDLLMRVREEGDWESWLKFFLRGVCEVSRAAAVRIKKILELSKAHHRLIEAELGNTLLASKLLDLLFESPLISVRRVESKLKCSYVSANKYVRRFCELGLLREFTGRRRNRYFEYVPYYELFETDDGEDTI